MLGLGMAHSVITRPPDWPALTQHEPGPGLGVLLVAPAVTEPGPEGGAGAGAPPTLWIPDEPVTLRTRAPGNSR